MLIEIDGRVIGSGQCYALTSQYAAYIDPQHIGGGLVGGMAAADIGKDYPWDKWGWEVVNNPKYSDLRPGDIWIVEAGGIWCIVYGSETEWVEWVCWICAFFSLDICFWYWDGVKARPDCNPAGVMWCLVWQWEHVHIM